MKALPENTMEEFIDTTEWVPVHTLPGFECAIEYYINKQGIVKSTKGNQDRVLKHRVHKSGYPMVTLTQRIGRRKPIYVCVHKIVAFAFLGSPPTPYGCVCGGSIIVHLDGDKSNCCADNLIWETRKKDS